MNLKNRKIVGLLSLIALAILFLVFVYGKVLANPNSYLFANSGDGIKNYYTYAFYIKNNTSNTSFEGLNFPYGENVMYTDCHPFAAFVLKSISNYYPLISNYTIGLLNFWMLFSLLVTMVVLFLIFYELKINSILSVLGAFSITILCPQIFRMTGHFALSYSFVIPLTIYFLIVYEKKVKRNSIVLLLFGSVLFYFFTHAYLGMIAALLIITYAAICCLNIFLVERKFQYEKYGILFLTAILPIILFFVFVKITDTHIGRTTNPWGIFESFADPRTVFLPIMGPFNSLKEWVFPNIKQTWEGWSYIGFSTILVLVFYFIVSLKETISLKKIVINKTWINNHVLRMLLISSIIILAFSMFLPFKLHLEKYINYFDIIKQYRALGRFAWVFYFVSTIVLVYIVNNFANRLFEKKRYLVAYVLIVTIPFSLFVEGFEYHTYQSRLISSTPNIFDLKQTDQSFQNDISNIPKNKYQAIIPFPFFYIGSENFGKPPVNAAICLYSFQYSYHCNIPILGSFLSRTSINESRKIMQLFASNFYQKEISNDLNSNKPFLIVSLNESLSDAEKEYLKKATLLVKHTEYSIYEIPKNVFFENSAKNEFNHFNLLKDKLYTKDSFLVSDTSKYFKFIDFESDNENVSFSKTNGSYYGIQKKFNTIFSVDSRILQLNRKYTARFWMYNKGENFGQDCLQGMIFFNKKENDKSEWIFPIVNAGNSHEIVGDWSLVEISFVHTDANTSYDLVLKGDDFSEKAFYIDELLFYDSELTIYKTNKTENKIELFKNNNRIVVE